MKIFTGLIIALLLSGSVYLVSMNVNVDTPDKLEEKSHQLFEMINRERISAGSHELIWSEKLFELATKHSLYMAESDNYTHSNYNYAENIMIGTDPEKVFKAWKESYWHNENMLNSQLRYGAVGMGETLSKYTSDNISIVYNQSRAFSTFMASSSLPIDNR